MICTKCSVDKPLDQYETYFHRPQNKLRTRKYCRDCFKEQKRKYRESIMMKKIIEPVVPELEIEVLEPQPVEQINPLSNNPDYKLCRTCQEYVHIDGYYHHGSKKQTTYLDCRKCCNKTESNKRRQEREEWRENTGGSDRIRNEVGVYEDEYQKEQCYMVMEVLGYTYSEECGHFLKPGVKEYVDCKLKFFKVNKEKFRVGQKIDYNTPEWREMYDLYMLGNCSQKQLSMKYGVSTATINKYINRTKNG
jgi:hypothetical protein